MSQNTSPSCCPGANVDGEPITFRLADPAVAEGGLADCEASAHQAAELTCDHFPDVPPEECATITAALLSICEDAVGHDPKLDWTLGYRPGYPDTNFAADTLAHIPVLALARSTPTAPRDAPVFATVAVPAA